MSDYGRALLAQLDASDLVELDRLLSGTRTLPQSPSLRVPLLTAAEAATLASVNPETIRRHVRAGTLTASRAGRTVRINVDDLETWMHAESSLTRAGSDTRRPRAARGRRPMADAIQRATSIEKPNRTLTASNGGPA